ncbi:MFS transporter [Caulobacter hibisci]|uniref:Multidrug efflux pump Tap n=1 Tax=Caulobacter hibisci TaxID=2035993 RepID=A0ABS0SXF4_9CAUL|nr:MFS transporter [Caulobacter hibisci]MBI1684296.1 MFS transporter [Caulobacter hibisci]
MAQPRHPFAFASFRYFWTARMCSVLAQNILVIVVGWQVYDMARATMNTKDAALQLGFVGLAQFAPLFVLTLVTGWAADRYDRRLIVCITTSLQLLCAAALGWLTWSGAATIPALLGVAVFLGVARAFSMPALNALGPNIVPPEVLPMAIATNAIASRVGAILGPAAGGYLYAWSPPVPYLASAGLFALSLFCMLLVRPAARTIGPPRKPWKLMLEGLVYVRANKLVLGAISLDLFAVLLGGATAMLPIFARDILHVGPEGLGHLRAAPAAGAMATALLFSWRPLKHDVGVKMLVAVVVFGVATVVFGLSRWLPLSLGCLAVLGAADMLSVYVRQSLIQLSTPDEMRGRVAAVSSLFISASNELGEAESGFLAAAVGPVPAVVFGGVGAIIITGLWAWWFPALRRALTFEFVQAEVQADTPPRRNG